MAGETRIVKDREAVDAAIAALDGEDREQVARLHRIITAAAPGLLPRTWYGMPAYSNGDKIIVFVRPRARFGEKYVTVGFNDSASIEDGDMWATNFAVASVTDDVAARITALVTEAVAGSARA